MPESNRLGPDTRGAILMLGIVMGALLVGALWHIAGIGDAIAWRERAQDAADAGAFENAVWNARGMNVIVAINIVMSLVLMVLVIWRLFLILSTIALVVASVLCVVTLGFGCGFAGVVARVETWMLQRDTAFSTNIVRILSGMTAAEVAVASATPVIGAGQADSNTSGAYVVTSATTWSPSLLPSSNIKGFKTLQRCLQGVKGGKMPKKVDPTTTKGKAFQFHQDFLSNPRMGFGVSLPVQVESYSLLCKKAGENVPKYTAIILHALGAPSGFTDGIDAAKTFLGRMTGSLPGLFCAPASGTAPDDLAELVGTRAVDSCKSEVKEKRQFVDNKGELETKFRDEDGNLLDEEEYVKGCAKKKKKEADKQLKGAFKTDSASYGLTECGTPAKVWEWAVNGNYFMRSFSTVEKDTPMSERDDRGLEVADLGATGNVVELETEEVVAHAEMYFDCSSSWMGDCKSDAPWQLRWGARLRRVQPLDKLLATAIEPAIVATLTQFLNETGGKNGDKLLDKLKKIPKIVVPKLKDANYYRYAKTNWAMGGMYSSGQFHHVGEFIIRHSSGNGVIH